ncbi:MAG: chorismate synthase [Planctomycetota bacterium]
MGNSFGQLFRVTTFGESHGGAVGVVIDGCPPRLELSEEDIQRDLDRRRPGQSSLVSQRQEEDRARLLSGVFEGRTLGTPIAIVVANADAKPEHYAPFKDVYRPSHADFTYDAKYGHRDWRGGGRASARETVGRVGAGAVAKKLLAGLYGTQILAYVTRVRAQVAQVDPNTVTAEAIEASPVRCPDPAASQRMVEEIQQARSGGDSVGGIVEAVARSVPPGLGDPVFDKLTADLAKALMSLPASRGFEIGSGFSAVELYGSEHNDPFVYEQGRIRAPSNRSGGIQGGISNGEPIVVRVAFKPTATVARDQCTVDRHGNATILKARGRHDPCVVPRAVPIVEAMMALVLADHALRQRGQCG